LSTATTKDPADFIRAPLTAWIDSPNSSHDTLARWLTGHGLSPIDTSEEPYIRLLRAIPVGRARAHYELQLARYVADLLHELPNVPSVVQPSDVDEFVYNLLLLSAGLRARDLLAPPLRSLFEQNAFGERSYLALPINNALRSALILNQDSNQLEAVWERMAAGSPDPVLRGTPHDGFQGALYMPLAPDAHGQPAVAAIGRTLLHLANHFTPEPAHRVGLFRTVLDEVMNRYPGYLWNTRMVRYSDEFKWPDWTDVALPSLRITIPRNQYILWAPTAKYIGLQLQIETLEQLCGGRIVRIRAPAESAELISLAAPVFERYRRRSSFGGPKAVIGILSAVFGELEQQTGLLAAAHPREANRIAHRKCVMDPTYA